MITYGDTLRMTEVELQAYIKRANRAADLRGRTVFVPRGTKLHICTGNNVPERAGRGYEVKIEHNVGDVVRWAGAGGYWRGAHVDDVEVLAR